MKIIINSIPKSGTHLAASLFNSLGFRESEIVLNGGIVRLYPDKNLFKYFTKVLSLSRSGNGFSIDLDNPTNQIKKKYLIKKLRRVRDNSYVKAHLPFSIELESVLLKNGFKICHIYRDPRDVAISVMNDVLITPLRKEFSNIPSFEEKLKLLLKGKNGIVRGHVLAPMQYHYLNTQGWFNSKNVLKLKFEDLIGEKGGGDKKTQIEIIKNVCYYIFGEVSNERVSEIADKIFDSNSKTFVNGRINKWKNKYTNKTRKLFFKSMHEILVEWGYESDDSWVKTNL